jgi:LuxR family transcriptional regulator, maltose regulon positive regulatory protein
MSGGQQVRDPASAGWHALSRGDWRAARACFEQALGARETPESFEGLAWAGYCLDDDALTFEGRERAYQLYRARGDDAAAARVAAWLAADCVEFRQEPAVANGWIRRAHRLLDGHDPGPDHGWLAAHEASFAIEDDPAEAHRLALQALDIGRRFAVPELEMVALGIEGLALVVQGEVDEGMRRLDEATAAALGGEAEILVCVAWSCCYLIAACEQVRDYDRAGQWCERIGEFCRRYDIGLMVGICRAKYAGVLTRQGRWDEAESELTVTADGLESARPGLAFEAVTRLGELRRRQGRLDEAERLLARCEGHAAALLTRAAIALDRGDAEEAAELADRYLRRFTEPGRTERSGGLELVVRARAQLGQHEQARAAVEQLRHIADRTRTPALRAAALVSEGTLHHALGDLDTARRRYEDALDLLAVGRAPFETAQVRLDLAGVLLALGRTRPARREAKAAFAALEEIGAALECDRARDLLAKIPDPQGPPGVGSEPLAGLTGREREVLALIAEGLSNQQIADVLVLSEHTVHRHVGNILRKLNLSSRTAAASLAARHGLV